MRPPVHNASAAARLRAVEKPREQAVDAEVLQNLTEIGVRFVANLASGVQASL